MNIIHKTTLVLPLLALACRSESTSPPAAEAAPPSTKSEPGVKPALPSPRPQGLRIGDDMVMADVEMRNVDGESLSLASVKGDKGTLVVFTCNHCPYAKAWEARVTALGNAYAKKGVGVVAVNPNDPSVQAEDGFDEMVARAEKLGMEFPYVVDATSDVARAFGASKTPEAFLFDADGALVYHGAVDDNAKDPDAVEATYLKDALDAVLAGEPVAVPTSKSVGCTIKFRPAS